MNGRILAMKTSIQTTIDGAGRLVLPKAIRERAGLHPGMPLDVRLQDGRIEIEPAPRAVRVVKKGALRVALPDGPLEPLTAEVVERVRGELRERPE